MLSHVSSVPCTHAHDDQSPPNTARSHRVALRSLVSVVALVTVACGTTSRDDGAPRAGDLRIVSTSESGPPVQTTDQASATWSPRDSSPPFPSSVPPPGDVGMGPGNAPPIPATRCEIDADCVRIERGCCPLGEYIAVHKDDVDAYQASLSCEAVACPFIMVADDHSMAQCHWQTHSCAVVKPKDIQCLGFSPNPHACPEGFRCLLPEHIADAPGQCLQQCGRDAVDCEEPGAVCMDDPTDRCVPGDTGAKYAGLCIHPGDSAFGGPGLGASGFRRP